jgi:hypothetical protein
VNGQEVSARGCVSGPLSLAARRGLHLSAPELGGYVAGEADSPRSAQSECERDRHAGQVPGPGIERGPAEAPLVADHRPNKEIITVTGPGYPRTQMMVSHKQHQAPDRLPPRRTAWMSH